MKPKLPKGMKEMDKAEVWINVVIETGVDEYGRTYRKTMWKKLEAPLSLGSVANQPQEKILQMKVVDTSRPNISKMFGGFFQ